MANRIKTSHIQQIMNDEKIVTIHIDEYLDLKETIKLLEQTLEAYKHQVKLLTKNQRKWYHLF